MKTTLTTILLLFACQALHAGDDHEFLPRSESPDGKYVVALPTKEALTNIEKPIAKLFNMETKEPVCDLPVWNSRLTVGNSNYFIRWKKDSSGFLFVQGLKWGADKVLLVEINGVVSITEITSAIRNLVNPSFQKSGAKRYNQYFDYIFDQEVRATPNEQGQPISDSGWTFDKNGNVKVDATCTNDPKHIDPNGWTVQFQGTWSRERDGFTDVKITRKRNNDNF